MSIHMYTYAFECVGTCVHTYLCESSLLVRARMTLLKENHHTKKRTLVWAQLRARQSWDGGFEGSATL
jgi:hypothetical protein